MKFQSAAFLSQLTIVGLTLTIFTSCHRDEAITPKITAPAMSAAKQMKMQERYRLQSEKMQQNPCSVEIWEDENFQDDVDLITGPMESTSMKDLPGADKRDWSDEIDSLRVGPKATVTVWREQDYQGDVLRFVPGTEKAGLHDNPAFGDDISSMKITCEP